MPSLGIGTAASSLFTPADISSLSLWLDASDSTTITQSSNEVSQWNDKSSKGYNVSQATAANMPLTNQSTKNSLNVLYFDGVTEILTNSSNSLLRNINGFSAFIVAQNLTTAAENRMLTKSISSSSPGAWLSFRRLAFPSKFNAAVRRITTAAVNLVDSTTNSNTNWNLTAIVANYSTSVLAYRLNKVEEATTSIVGSGNSSDVDGGPITVGALAVGAGQFTNMYLGEILVYEKILSTNETNIIENYLASKWGL